MFERRTLIRYWLFQLPGLGVAGGLLGLALGYGAISPAVAAALFALWFLKDVALYPLTWKAYVPHAGTGDERLAGRAAVALTGLAPEGKVRLGGEIWNARSADGTPIAAGTPVKVMRNEGLCLIVAPAAQSAP